MHGNTMKKSLFSLLGVKTGGDGGGGRGKEGVFSRTPCQEGRTRAEQHHSGRKKTSAFQGGQARGAQGGAGGQRNSEVASSTPGHTVLLASSLPADCHKYKDFLLS